MRFFGISHDKPDESRSLADKIAADGKGLLGFPLLSDLRAHVVDRYGLRDPEYKQGIPHPTVIVLDAKGKIRWMKIESDYRVRPTNEEVAAALDAFE